MKKYGLNSRYYVAEYLICSHWDIEMATILYEEELGRYMDKKFACLEDFSLDEHLVTIVLELQKKNIERTNFFASSINSWRLFVALSSGRWRMSSNKVGVPACAEAVAHVKAEASAPSPNVNFPENAVLTANEGNFNDKYLTSSLTK